MDIFSDSIDLSQTLDEVLMACVIGQTASGKSSSMGTLSGEKVLYIATSCERHGVMNAIKHHKQLVAEGKVKESKFVHIDLGVFQDIDVKTGLFDSGVLKEGDLIPPEAQEVKLNHYIAYGANATTVVIDSLTTLYEVFVKSGTAQSQCISSKGNWDSFAEYRVVGSLYNTLIEKLTSLNAKGVKTICTCIAKLEAFTEKDGVVMPTKFSPDLPSVNISKNILARFATTVLCFRHPSILNNRPHFNFNIQGTRTTLKRNSEEISNNLNVDLRVQYLPFGKPLSKIPADWGKMKENVAKQSALDEAKEKTTEDKAKK